MSNLYQRAEIHMDTHLDADEVQIAFEIMDEEDFKKLAIYFKKMDKESVYKLLEQRIIDWLMEELSYEN